MAESALDEQVTLLGAILGETIAELRGRAALDRVEAARRAAVALRAGALPGGREAFGASIAALGVEDLALLASAFTHFFHLINAAEEQHRIRVLRGRDRPGAPPAGSVAAGCRELAAAGAQPEDVQRLLDRLLVMPVLTAHPTEARRRTVLDHLGRVSGALDALDDRRAGARDRDRTLERLREAVAALVATSEARAVRPSVLDEVRAGTAVFERTLLDAVPAVYRALEDGLAAAFPGVPFRVGAFLRFGTWIGGDRDGNPNVTAEVTRAALERQRAVALRAHQADAAALERELSVAHPHGADELEASLEADRARLPAVAAVARALHAAEPWREKLRYVAARLAAARSREDGAYPDARAYLDDLRLVARTLAAAGHARLARGRLADAIRRAESFGFHLATLDVRQHSAVHERAVAELLAAAGRPGYAALDEAARVALLADLTARPAFVPVADPATLSPEANEVLETLRVVGRARRDIGPEACERYIVSFCSSASDLLEVVFLARAARLAPDELRPVPLLEQLEDLERARDLAGQVIALEPLRAALRGELEVMIGYSDSGKQAGYVASQVALQRAQLALAEVAEASGLTLTIFHGRGGAVGRGGGPANRAIRAQPPPALRGRFRVTEQGETITARYGRAEVARRDLEQMVNAVLVASWQARAPAAADADRADRAREEAVRRAAEVARRAYEALVADPDRLAAYTVAATPIREVQSLRIASRPASRSKSLRLEDLRAISWVFSWNQSRHGIPGWFGLGSALEALAASEGTDRVRALYQSWPFLTALVDNARLALTQADLDVAAAYARLAPPEARGVFELIRAEHAKTVRLILDVSGDAALLSRWPTLARTVKRRDPYVDVLSHVQVAVLGRLEAAPAAERARLEDVLRLTVNGIAAGLQTVG
ncbi:MAG: phosphoenolpyruvate carboxylase [Anaeromyxobacteraceae bacterium]